MAKNDSKNDSKNAARSSGESNEEVIYVLNPAANLGGFALADGKSIFAGEGYRASEEEYAERSAVHVSRSDGSTVAVVVKD